jgi:PAS domain S-box-containing protein
MGHERSVNYYALKVALPYFVLGWLWILASDRFLKQLTDDVETLTVLQTYKGWFFVTVSALLVFYTSRRYLAKLLKTAGQLQEKDRALSESQITMLTLLGNLPGMAYRCTYGENRKMNFVSEGCLALTGYDSAAFLKNAALSYDQLMLEEDREMVRQQMQRAIRQKTPFQVGYRIRTRSGQSKWVWEHGCILHSERKEPGVLVGYIFDIAEKGQLERPHRGTDPVPQPGTGDQQPDPNQCLNVLSRRL